MEVIRDLECRFLCMYKGKINVTDNIDKAYTFANGDAEYFIKHNIRKSLRKNYSVLRLQKTENIDDTVKETQIILPKSTEIISKEEQHDNIDTDVFEDTSVSSLYINDTTESIKPISSFNAEVDKAICDFVEIFARLNQKRNQCENDLRDIDAELCDLLHASEFYELNDEDGSRLYQMIHIARQRRRIIKNTLDKIDLLQSSNIDDWKRGSTKSRLDKINNRQYAPRTLSDLFKKLDKGEKI